MIQKGKFIKNQYLVLYNKDSLYTYPHFGIAITKKIGNAVERNKQKRRMRVLLDKYKNQLRTNKDYIIIMKEKCKNISFQELEENLQNLIERIEYETKK